MTAASTKTMMVVIEKTEVVPILDLEFEIVSVLQRADRGLPSTEQIFKAGDVQASILF